MLKVAIVGCGKIADSHVLQILRIEGCSIVGVCDREKLMARQLFERFPIAAYYDDLDLMLREAKPDVVHITTPPQGHAAIATQCLNFGCHVYVEKPFTIDVEEAEEVIALANARGLKVTVGHDDQFSHVARRLRALVLSGYLGGAPVHLESHYGYELNDKYARAILGDRGHWVRQLPGALLHNVISHGVARVAEYFRSSSPELLVHGFISPALRAMGEREIVDELRVIISEADGPTAYFTFSSQIRPSLQQFRVYGTENSILLDEDHQTLLLLKGTHLKSYADKFIPPVGQAAQYLRNVGRNLRTFLANDFHMKSGMKFLIESFYRSIVCQTEPPIPYSEILRTTRLMENIFAQLAGSLSRTSSMGREPDEVPQAANSSY